MITTNLLLGLEKSGKWLGKHQIRERGLNCLTQRSIQEIPSNT